MSETFIIDILEELKAVKTRIKEAIRKMSTAFILKKNKINNNNINWLINIINY